jgi:hypothetical protein
VLVRLARLVLVVALLAGWQAAVAHSIEHGSEAHEESSLCDALDALTACAPDVANVLVGYERSCHSLPSYHEGAPRVAEAPPFLSQGPPIASV